MTWRWSEWLRRTVAVGLLSAAIRGITVRGNWLGYVSIATFMMIVFVLAVFVTHFGQGPLGETNNASLSKPDGTNGNSTTALVTERERTRIRVTWRSIRLEALIGLSLGLLGIVTALLNSNMMWLIIVGLLWVSLSCLVLARTRDTYARSPRANLITTRLAALCCVFPVIALMKSETFADLIRRW